MENCIKMETNDSFIDLAQGIDFPSGSSYDKNKNSDFIDEKKVKDEELAEENRAKQVEAEKNKMYRPGDSLRLGNNASPSQVDALVAFLEEHQDLARGRLRTAAGRVRSKQLWARITKKLNAQGECIKSVKQWQKIWTDKKYLAKKAAAAARSANRSGTTTPNQLSLIEQRIVALLGKDYEPETEAPEPRDNERDDFSSSSSSDNSASEKPLITHINNSPDHSSQKISQFKRRRRQMNPVGPELGIKSRLLQIEERRLAIEAQQAQELSLIRGSLQQLCRTVRLSMRQIVEELRTSNENS